MFFSVITKNLNQNFSQELLLLKDGIGVKYKTFQYYGGSLKNFQGVCSRKKQYIAGTAQKSGLELLAI